MLIGDHGYLAQTGAAAYLQPFPQVGRV